MKDCTKESSKLASNRKTWKGKDWVLPSCHCWRKKPPKIMHHWLKDKKLIGRWYSVSYFCMQSWIRDNPTFKEWTKFVASFITFLQIKTTQWNCEVKILYFSRSQFLNNFYHLPFQNMLRQTVSFASLIWCQIFETFSLKRWMSPKKALMLWWQNLSPR